GEHPGQRRVLRDAHGAVGLHGVVDDVERHVGDGDLDPGDLGPGGLVAGGVHQPGGVERVEAGLVDGDAGVGHPGLHHALVGQGLAEGAAGVGPSAHELQRPFGGADRPHAVVDAARAEAGLGDGEAAALLAEEVGHRDAHVLQRHLHVALGVVVAEDEHVAQDGDAGRVHRHQDHRLLPVGRGVGVGLAHHDEDAAVGVQRSADEPLAAVDDVVVAVAPDGAGDVGGVGRGHLRLGHGESGADLALEERLQPLLLLLDGAEHGEDLHVAGVGSRAVADLGGDGGAAHDLGQRGVVGVGQPVRPFGLVGQEQVPEPAAAGLDLELLDDRRVVVRIARGRHLLLVDVLRRVDALGHEPRQLSVQLLAPGAGGEVHAQLFFVVVRRAARLAADEALAVVAVFFAVPPVFFAVPPVFLAVSPVFFAVPLVFFAVPVVFLAVPLVFFAVPPVFLAVSPVFFAVPPVFFADDFVAPPALAAGAFAVPPAFAAGDFRPGRGVARAGASVVAAGAALSPIWPRAGSAGRPAPTVPAARFAPAAALVPAARFAPAAALVPAARVA